MVIKLWGNYKVEESRNFGMPQESMMHIWVFCGLCGCCFFSMDGYIMMLSLECCRNHWKVKKVFLNVQNKWADNFHLLKSLTNTCKQLYFFTKKMNAHKDLFQNITYCISKILLSSNSTYLKGYLSKFLCK